MFMNIVSMESNNESSNVLNQMQFLAQSTDPSRVGEKVDERSGSREYADSKAGVFSALFTANSNPWQLQEKLTECFSPQFQESLLHNINDLNNLINKINEVASEIERVQGIDSQDYVVLQDLQIFLHGTEDTAIRQIDIKNAHQETGKAQSMAKRRINSIESFVNEATPDTNGYILHGLADWQVFVANGPDHRATKDQYVVLTGLLKDKLAALGFRYEDSIPSEYQNCKDRLRPNKLLALNRALIILTQLDNIVLSKMLATGIQRDVDDTQAIGGDYRMWSVDAVDLTWTFPIGRRNRPTEIPIVQDNSMEMTPSWNIIEVIKNKLKIIDIQIAVPVKTANGEDGLAYFQYKVSTTWRNHTNWWFPIAKYQYDKAYDHVGRMHANHFFDYKPSWYSKFTWSPYRSENIVSALNEDFSSENYPSRMNSLPWETLWASAANMYLDHIWDVLPDGRETLDLENVDEEKKPLVAFAQQVEKAIWKWWFRQWTTTYRYTTS